VSAPLRGESRTVDLGPPVHYVDFGGSAPGPTLVLVHGLGGSHLNWSLLAPQLTPLARVLALDLPGFGMSRPTRRPATVRRNVAVLTRFVQETAGPPVVLVGNSMGGLVCAQFAARAPDLVRGLVLLDPALPAPSRVLGSPATAVTLALHALPGVGERLRRAHRRRLGARATVRETLHLCGVDEQSLPAELVNRSIALVERQTDVAGFDRVFLSASRSLAWSLVRARRYRAIQSSIVAPVLLVHGDEDRLVPVSAARATAQAHPAWRFVELPGVGHLPQLQVPGELGMHIRRWLGELPGDAAAPGAGTGAITRPAPRR
jgi:pimeloyl-ACP methyl ester carboxylesterase